MNSNLTIDLNNFKECDKGLSNKMLYISIFYYMGRFDESYRALIID